MPTEGSKYPAHTFCMMLGDGVLIPGMRIYAGVIQAPARKSKVGWHPQVYFSPELAVEIHDAVRRECPNLSLAPVESTVRYLSYDPFTINRLNLAAQVKQQEGGVFQLEHT